MPALRRRHHRRPRRDRAGLAHLRRPVGDDERLDDRRQRRRLADHRRLLDDLRPAGAGRRRSCCASAPCSTPSLRDRHARHEHRHRHWNNPPQTASASVSIDVGGIAGVGVLNGTAWHDADFDDVLDANERVLEGWTVELYRNGRARALGDRRMRPASIASAASRRTTRPAIAYELRFRAPGAGANTAKLGRADSAFTNDLQRITDIVVQPGSNLQNLNLPIEPNGVVYNSMSRTPIAGRDPDACSRRAAALRCRRAASTIRRSRARSRSRRLLQVRPQLHRPGLPERRRLPDRRDAAGVRLRRRLLADHSADVGRLDRAVLRAVVPGQRRRRDSRRRLSTAKCSLPSSRRRRGSGAQRRHDLPRAPDARRQPGAGLEPDLQQPHSARSGARRRARDHARRRRCST